jgi:hypothetical protein
MACGCLQRAIPTHDGGWAASLAPNALARVAPVTAVSPHLQVLEIKSKDDQARRLLGECCAAMNAEYMKMRNVKRQARTLDPNCPLTKVGDFMQPENAWVKNVRG